MFWITSEKQLKELRSRYNVEVSKVFEDRALVRIVIEKENIKLVHRGL